MKNRTLITLLAIAMFAWLNWATSQEEPMITLNMTASLGNESVILTNNDSVDVSQAMVTIVGLPGRHTESRFDLPAGATDSIAFSSFLSTDNIPFPPSGTPTSLELFFWDDNANYNFAHEF